MDEQINQSEHSALPITLVVVVVVIVVILIVFGFVGKNAGNDQLNDDNVQTELNEVQKEEIRKALESEEVPELTVEQEEEITEALQAEEVPELTEAQREEIRKSLAN